MQSTNPTTLFPGEITLENLDDLFAFHRSRFGGVTMELEEGGEEPEASAETPAEQEAPEGSDEESEESGDEETPPGEGDDNDDDSKLDLDGAVKALSKVRKSEAKMRQRLREAEEKLAKAKTPEELEAVKSELSTANAEESRSLLVENVALKAGLPEELADALKGDTREELEAHAKVLAKFAPKDTVPNDDPDLSGGLAPGSGGGEGDFDPLAAARRARGKHLFA